jgi:hypothetical protein
VLIAVGAEDHRPLAVLRLQAVRIQLGLLLAHLGALLGALGFHQRQRLAVVTPQHIVHKALALLVGHAGDLDLEVLVRVELPAGLLQQQVDEIVAGFGFGIVVRVGGGSVGQLGSGHLLAQPGQLGIQRSRGAQQGGEPFIALGELRLQLLQLVQGLRWHGRCCGGRPGQKRRVEGQPGVGPAALAIGARQPVADVEQFARGHLGICRRHLAGAVHGLVAQFLDHLGLGEHGLAHHPGEAGLVDQRAQVVLVGQAQATVMLVEPGHRQFQCAPGVETGGPCIGVHHVFGLGGRLVQQRPLGQQETEVAHACPPH